MTASTARRNAESLASEASLWSDFLISEIKTRSITAPRPAPDSLRLYSSMLYSTYLLGELFGNLALICQSERSSWMNTFSDGVSVLRGGASEAFKFLAGEGERTS